MKSVALAVGVAAMALAVCAGAIFGLGDGRTLVPAPEGVAEDFLRAVWMKRYPQAARYLAEDAQLGDEALAALHARLEEASGGIQDVRGGEGRIAGDEALGTARVRGGRATVTVTIHTHRVKGEWRISAVALAP